MAHRSKALVSHRSVLGSIPKKEDRIDDQNLTQKSPVVKGCTHLFIHFYFLILFLIKKNN